METGKRKRETGRRPRYTGRETGKRTRETGRRPRYTGNNSFQAIAIKPGMNPVYLVQIIPTFIPGIEPVKCNPLKVSGQHQQQMPSYDSCV